MKKLLFILALVICLTFAACGDTAIDNQLPPATVGTPDVSEPEGTSEDVDDTQADAEGEIIPYNQLQTDMYLSRETRTDGNGNVVTDIRYTYDSEGRVLSAINADGSGYKYEYPDYSTEIEYHLTVGGEVYQKWVREYDGKHQLMSNLCYDAEGKLIGESMSYSYVYSEPNMISQIRQYTTDLEHYNTTDIEYANGNVTSRTYKDENGNVTSIETYEFDEEGRTIASTAKDYINNWESYERYEYSQDEDGNTVTKCYRGDSDELEYMNIFDSEGRLVLDVVYDMYGTATHKTEVIRDGDSEITTTYLYEVLSSITESKGNNYVRSEQYDTDGKLDSYTIFESTPTKTTYSHYDADNNLTSKNVYEYGEDGRPLSVTVYYADFDFEPMQYNKYTYDENNLLIEEEDFWDVETGISVITYEYTKIDGVYRTLENPYGHD